MTTDGTFRHAIAAAPLDAMPRLVYADYLDERGRGRESAHQRVLAEPDDDAHRELYARACEAEGDAARAEFVRVQVQLARYDEMSFAECPECECPGQGYAHADDCPRSPRHHLRLRERELLRKAWEQIQDAEPWRHFVCDGISLDRAMAPRLVFRRGFVTELTLSWTDWLQHHFLLLESCCLRNAKDGLVRLADMPRPEVVTCIIGSKNQPNVILYRLPGHMKTFSQPTDSCLFLADVARNLLEIEYPGLRIEPPSARDADRDFILRHPELTAAAGYDGG